MAGGEICRVGSNADAVEPGLCRDLIEKSFMKKNACPECGSAVEIGFIPDRTFGGMMQSGWYPGEPQISWLTEEVKCKDDPVPLIAYRCTKCGRVKLYANRPANGSDDPSGG